MARPPTRRSRRAHTTHTRRVVVLLILLLAIAAAIVIVLVDNGSDEASPPHRTTTSTTRATTSSSSATTTAVTTTTAGSTSTTVALPTLGGPETYARYLFAAWQNNDRTSAAKAASSDAVAQMFAQAYQPGTGGANPWGGPTCGAAAGSEFCTWKTSAGAQIQIQVRTATGGLPIQVIAVQRS